MNITNVLIIAGIAFVIFMQLKRKKEDFDPTKIIEDNARLKAELSQKDQKLGETINLFETEKSQRNELAGKNKQMFAETTSLKAENQNLIKDKERLTSELTRFQEEETRKSKEQTVEITKLDESRKALDDERNRIRREDEAELERAREARDRMWNEHENVVKSKLAELCSDPRYNFKTYDNVNLPEGFSGKFKPDFMIEFLGQYVIFDAKASKSGDLQAYISKNVKDTVEKIAANQKIYPTVYFIVPLEAIPTLTKTRFYEQEYNFIVTTVESIPIILEALKTISAYETIEQLDPRERENIVNLVAAFDYHINLRNAFDLLGAEMGISVLDKVNILEKDMKDSIAHKKSEIRLQQFTPNEIKALMLDLNKQQQRVKNLTEPKVAISPEDMNSVRLLIETND